VASASARRTTETTRQTRLPKHKITKRKKSSGKPSRPLSAYNVFYRDERVKWLAETAQHVRCENTEAIDSKSRFLDMGKAISSRWKLISPEERVKYEKIAQEDKKRYNNEKKEYNEQILRGTKLGRAFLERRTILGSNSAMTSANMHTTVAAVEEETGAVTIPSIAMLHPQPPSVTIAPDDSATARRATRTVTQPVLQASMIDHRERLHFPNSDQCRRNETPAMTEFLETVSLAVLLEHRRQEQEGHAIYQQRQFLDRFPQIGSTIADPLVSDVASMQPRSTMPCSLQERTELLRAVLSQIEQLLVNNIRANAPTFLSSLTRTPSHGMNTETTVPSQVLLHAWTGAGGTAQQHFTQHLPQNAHATHLAVEWLESALTDPESAQSWHGGYEVNHGHQQG